MTSTTTLSAAAQAAMSAANAKKPIVCSIMGPQDAGKTILAASVSAQFAGVPAKDPIVIEDIAWIAVDHHSLTGLRAAGYTVKHAIDLTAMLSEAAVHKAANLQEAVNTVLGVTREFVLKAGCKHIVVDTVSVLDNLINDHVVRTLNKQGPAAYGEVSKVHTQLSTALPRLPANLFYLFHEKAVIAQAADGKQSTEDAKKKYQEQEGMEDGDLDIAMYYKGLKGLYLSDSILKLEVRNEMKLLPGASKKALKRTVYTKRAGSLLKNKFPNLPAENEPNLRNILTLAGVL